MDTAARYFELYDEAALAHDVTGETAAETAAAKGEPQS
jgi:tryptophan synthase beta chain